MPRHLPSLGPMFGVLLATLALTTRAPADDVSPGGTQQAAAEAALRELGEKYVAAFNQQDSQAIAAFWSPNAVYTNRLTGEQVTGRDAIAAQFTNLFKSSPDAKIQVSIESIRFVSPNVAVEKGVSTFVADPPIQIPYSAVYVQQDGKWLLDRVTDTPQPLTRSHYEQLQPLEWMIGSWVDKDDNVTIQAECKWTKNKNFINRTFSISMNGEVQISGMQLIGWDAGEKRIRSWTFDSDGGFAQATWSNQGQDWYAIRKGRTADGKAVSAVHVIKFVDDNAYTLQAVQRARDGQILPNTAEVMVVRQ